MGAAPWRVALGVHVQQRRLERGWSVRQASAKCRVSATTWHRIEAGSHVDDRPLVDVADCLGWPRGEAFRIMANALDEAEQNCG